MSNDKMREALMQIRNALQLANHMGGPICDTIWMPNTPETLFDFIDSTLSAQASAEPVAYLDIGAGGYIDIGSDLSDDVLMKLPKGRHMLTIVGTYGIDGYVPVEPPRAASPVVPEAIEPDDAPEMIPDDEEDMKNAYADGWNACRQALLATSAPSEPCRFHGDDSAACEKHSGDVPCDADPNAPWLSKAHNICTNAGIAQGNISDRLDILFDVMAGVEFTIHAPSEPKRVELTDYQLMLSFGKVPLQSIVTDDLLLAIGRAAIAAHDKANGVTK